MTNTFEELENLDLEEVVEMLAANAVQIHRLEKKVADLQESDRRHDEWLRKAKEEAGYHNNISFDIVWKEVLAKSKEVK